MRRRAREHAGFVLLAVLTVSMLASLTVVSLLYRSRAEVTASTASRGSWQAMRAAMSGIERAIQVVAANGYDRARWHDVPEIFERQLVEEEGFERWYFTVYSPDEVALGDVRSGVEDQSARFRIGALDHDTLARLANIDVTRVDQLLADQDSALDSELGAYLTSWRTEYTIDRRYRRQVDINRDIDPVATLEIPEAAIEFIAEARRLADDRAAFRHPVELLDATLKISGEDGKELTIKSGIDTTGIHSILDRCRTDPHDSYATHTINVNTASAEILALVKGVDESLAQSIVTKRRGVDPRRRLTTAWILREGLVDAARFKTVAPRLTSRGFQYRLHVVGFGVPSGRYRVLQAGIDVSPPRPRIVHLRDLTRHGLPFSLVEESDARDR